MERGRTTDKICIHSSIGIIPLTTKATFNDLRALADLVSALYAFIFQPRTQSLVPIYDVGDLLIVGIQTGCVTRTASVIGIFHPDSTTVDLPSLIILDLYGCIIFCWSPHSPFKIKILPFSSPICSLECDGRRRHVYLYNFVLTLTNVLLSCKIFAASLTMLSTIVLAGRISLISVATSPIRKVTA